MNNILRQNESIIIADTQALIIEGLKAILGGKYSITNVVSTKKELIGILEKRSPSVLILDFFTLDFNGYDDLIHICKNYPETRIIILTYNLVRNEIMEYHNMGIRNILHKSVDGDELLECMESILKGKKYYSAEVLDLLFDPNEKKSQASPAQLTASEIEIVRLISQGLTNKEIAIKKILSIHTIMTHRKNILRKVGVSNASELIMYAIKSGLIDNIEYHI